MAKMSNRAFLAVWIPVLAVVTALFVALNILAVQFQAFADQYFGKYGYVGGKKYTVESIAGSESWDSNYYNPKYGDKASATKAAEAFVTRVGEEGVVLLKNENGALPLATTDTVALMGRYAADPVYGGSGSGNVDAATAVNFKQGLENAGFSVNSTMYSEIDRLKKNVAKADIVMDKPKESTYYIGEIPVASISAAAQESVKGQPAVIVIGRGGGEGGDLARDLKSTLDGSTGMKANAETASYEDGQHQLELTKEEKDLIAFAKANCPKVIVVINASTTLEIGALKEGEYAADAILVCGSIGSTAANAVGTVLSGATNPSGRTVDTWAADFTQDPTFYNFGNFRYTNVDNYYGGNAYFVEYKEGIYVGYRYYETADAEAKAGNYEGFDYDAAVVYPFGYGLSYTTFEQKLESVRIEGNDVRAVVNVKNTGNTAGKEVVELYYTSPYTKGGIEKSEVVLAAFAKTKSLAPGESEHVELEYPFREMASWSSAEGGYLLDGGNYRISLRSDSHTVLGESSVHLNRHVYRQDSTGGALENRFGDCTEYMERECTAFSRSDFKGTFPAPATDKEANETVKGALTEYDVAADNHPEDEMPAWENTEETYQLIDLRGVDYDDERWDALLGRITTAEMLAVVNDGAYNTGAIPNIGKPQTKDPDGPQGFTSLAGSTGNCAYCSETLMAQTWNAPLMYELGVMIGEEALASGYNGWYAPAENMHRSPFAGRNFEYYSEDGCLAGKMGAAVVSGAASKGCYGFVKHFAMNDQETNRVDHLCTWADEQTIREIYLKPFEYTVKEATVTLRYLDGEGNIQEKEMRACTAMMSSFNYVGAVWAGGRKSLQTGVLRDEWGFEGMVITDFNLYSFMPGDQGIRAGSDLMLTYRAYGSPKVTDGSSATGRLALQKSIKNILYTVANSNAMQGAAPGSRFIRHMAYWQVAVYVATGLAAIFVVCGIVAIIVRLSKNRKN